MFANPGSKTRIISRLVLFAVALIIFPRSAYSDVAVGTCRPNLVHFDNLDDAVHGVPNGATILVCPGTYAEQVSVNASLTLKGVQDGNGGLPVIVPPPGGLVQNATGYNLPASFTRNAPLAAQILVNPGATVNISGIAFDTTKSLLTGCSLFPVGVVYHDSSGTVDHVAMRNQITPCTFGNGSPNPQGEGVLVQSNGVASADVLVENSSFDNFGLMALEANGPVTGGTTLTAQSNTLVGPGNTQGNGIYLSYANGNISNNIVSNALHSGETTGFLGIITECSPTFAATNNRVSNTLIGIYVTNSSAFCTVSLGGYSITGNHVFNTQSSGIEACGPNNTIQGNTINDSGQAGVSLDDAALGLACGTQTTTVSSNTVNGACAAVLQGPANLGNLIGPNTIFNSKFLLLIGTSCQ